jgi:hypothetical protein
MSSVSSYWGWVLFGVRQWAVMLKRLPKIAHINEAVRIRTAHEMLGLVLWLSPDPLAELLSAPNF